MQSMQVRSLIGELRSHTLQNNWALAQQQLSPRTLEPMHGSERSQMMQWISHILQLRPHAVKFKKKKIFFLKKLF